jgi:hypothetical protein
LAARRQLTGETTRPALYGVGLVAITGRAQEHRLTVSLRDAPRQLGSADAISPSDILAGDWKPDLLALRLSYLRGSVPG